MTDLENKDIVEDEATVEVVETEEQVEDIAEETTEADEESTESTEEITEEESTDCLLYTSPSPRD